MNVDNTSCQVLKALFLLLFVRLGDYYLLDSHHPTRDESVIMLRDHGCEIISGLKEGKVNVVIGTHRLLSKDIVFKDLGFKEEFKGHGFDGYFPGNGAEPAHYCF